MDELNRLDVAAFKAAPKSKIVLVLDNIRSRNNVGAIFRTADAFRVEEIVLCGITPTPPHMTFTRLHLEQQKVYVGDMLKILLTQYTN